VAGVLVLVLPTGLVIWLDLGLHGAWLSATAFVAVMGTAFLLRFVGGKWQRMRVIEPVVTEDVPAEEPLIEVAPIAAE
jgi:Na+-driven multidrug efflux pump